VIFTPATFAEQSTYFEIGYSGNTIKDDTNFLGSYNNGAIKISLGAEVLPGLAVEGSLGTGVGDDTNNVLGVPVTVKTNGFATLYARPFVKLNEQVEFFGRVGYFRGEIEATVRGQTFSDTEGDLSYGVGFAFNLTKESAIVLDWMKYYDKDGVDVSGVGIAYRFRFK
jgi:hypothetical protein